MQNKQFFYEDKTDQTLKRAIKNATIELKKSP